MNLNSITFLKPIPQSEIPISQRNTNGAVAASRIVDMLKNVKPGEALPFSVQDFGHFERYNLQTNINKAGHRLGIHARVQVKGELKVVQKDGHKHAFYPQATVYVKRITDAEWKEWQAKPGKK